MTLGMGLMLSNSSILASGGGGGSTTTTVWNTTTGTNKSGFLTISGTPALTVTGPGNGFGGAPCYVRATNPQTGKKHFEITLNTYAGGANPYIVGVDDGATAFGPGSVFPAPYAGSVIYRSNGGGAGAGIIYVNGTIVQTPASSSSSTNGDVLVVEFDTTAGTLSLFLNGTQIGTTVTGLSLANWYPVVADEQSDILIANFGQSAFTKTPTAGYSALS